MARALVLNADRIPLHVLTGKRALALVLYDKAYVLEYSEEVFRSEKLTFQVPSVICLTEYKNVPYYRRVGLTTRAVLRRDGRTCAYCGKDKANTVDHVVPRSRGGRNDWKNVVAACKPCNSAKGNKTLKELGWKCRHTLYEPKGQAQFVSLVSEIKPEWMKYFDHLLEKHRTKANVG